MKVPLGTFSGYINPSDMSDENWRVLREECEQVFTPGTSIKESDLFAGRIDQISKLTSVLDRQEAMPWFTASAELGNLLS